MNNIENQYLELLQDILDNGVKKKVRNGETIGVFGRTLRHDMKLGFPLLTTKKMAWKQIVTELLWFLCGESNIQSLVRDGNYIWVGDAYAYYDKKNGKVGPLTKDQFIERIKTNDDFAEVWGDMGPIYGVQWRHWESLDTMYVPALSGPGMNINTEIDQIQHLLNTLKNNPDDRRMIVSAWNVDKVPEMKLPPCHYSFQVYTRELSNSERMDYWFDNHKPNRDVCDSIDESAPNEQTKYWDEAGVPARAISLLWNQRSVDTPLGLPFNIASYALLLEILGKYNNMIPEELIANLGDTHIYTNQIDGVKEQITREPNTLATLNIHPGILDYDIDKLEYGMFTLENYNPHSKIEFPLSN